MFQQRRMELELRRSELVARSRMLRGQLAEQIAPVQRSFAVVDRVREGIRWLMAHPLWLVPLVAVPIILRPRRAWAWTWRVWTGWKIWQRTKALIVTLEERYRTA